MASSSRRRIISEELDDAASEMDMSVQVESEDQEDIVTNTPSKRRTRAMRIVDYDEESAVEEEEEEVEEEEEDVEASEADELESDQESEPPIPALSKIKIKLKLPHLTASVASSRRTSRDEEEEDEIESEDSDSVDPSTRSASVVGGGRTLTARQAVLANVVDPTHVSLNQPASGRKKKPLTELEIALKREETARKRKNLTEKKLEDEKAETINRLLKKQSRSKTKRNAPLQVDTPLEGEAEDVVETPPVQVIPTMYRWVSTSRPRPLIEEVDNMKTDNESERTMSLSFSVPFIALPQTSSAT
ncbi:PAPA-1-like conserved region-domain-containing protein [Thelephora terrestris]|uniref:PAPA-1-like conserved region-domain-containing protein n=1 Tax=Thelephora terrestris TaxID=56493 RepID=A0A9P6HI64_9AGAM|nr:PAPA-1-like conserved region-domain-containing protein [Thelephora terrestris]